MSILPRPKMMRGIIAQISSMPLFSNLGDRTSAGYDCSRLNTVGDAEISLHSDGYHVLLTDYRNKFVERLGIGAENSEIFVNSQAAREFVSLGGNKAADMYHQSFDAMKSLFPVKIETPFAPRLVGFSVDSRRLIFALLRHCAMEMYFSAIFRPILRHIIHDIYSSGHIVCGWTGSLGDFEKINAGECSFRHADFIIY